MFLDSVRHSRGRSCQVRENCRFCGDSGQRCAVDGWLRPALVDATVGADGNLARFPTPGPVPSPLQTVAGCTCTRLVRSLIVDSAALAGLPISMDTQRIRVIHLLRSLRFYLALDCEVRLSGDGWVQLCNADTLFILEHSGTSVRSGGIVPELIVGNLLHLCRRLWSASIDTSPISYPACAPGGRITTRDPDLHAVSISQAESR